MNITVAYSAFGVNDISSKMLHFEQNINEISKLTATPTATISRLKELFNKSQNTIKVKNIRI